MEEREARLALTYVVEPGACDLSELVARSGAVSVWRALAGPGSEGAWARRAKALDLRGVLSPPPAGLRFVTPGDAEWPPGLGGLRGAEAVQAMGGPPLGLWVKGQPPLDEVAAKAIAIVGSRAATTYGEAVAEDVAAGVAEAGWSVISGGAYGIDAAAHGGCLAVGGLTVAVLACGADQVYPPSHRALFGRIVETGLVVSELPPGAHPTRMRFLARNRLIAALSQGVVIVEAAHRSGARNTVTWAQTMGRPIMAVPGPVHSATSATPHRLIRDQEAVLVTSARDVLDVAGPLGATSVPRPHTERPVDRLGKEHLAVFESVPARGAISPGELALRSGTPIGRCLAIVAELQASGMIATAADGGVRLASRRESHACPGQLG